MYREKKFQTNTLLYTYLLTKIFVKEKCKQEKVNRKKNPQNGGYRYTANHVLYFTVKMKCESILQILIKLGVIRKQLTMSGHNIIIVTDEKKRESRNWNISAGASSSQVLILIYGLWGSRFKSTCLPRNSIMRGQNGIVDKQDVRSFFVIYQQKITRKKIFTWVIDNQLTTNFQCSPPVLQNFHLFFFSKTINIKNRVANASTS